MLRNIQAHARDSTIGAGDTFIAGMMYGFLSHEKLRVEGHGMVENARHTDDLKRDYEDMLRFANHLAGLKVKREGFSGLAEAVFKEDGKVR